MNRLARRIYDRLADIHYWITDLAVDIAPPILLIAGIAGYAYIIIDAVTCP
jgi:hypothetical protein